MQQLTYLNVKKGKSNSIGNTDPSPKSKRSFLQEDKIRRYVSVHSDQN